MGNASDFQLPEEVLRVMPTDPYEQLDIARKITSIAIASRVTKLEAENSKLRQSAADKDGTIRDLQEKLSQLECAFHDVNARLARALEGQSKLLNERNTLASTVKKLNRDVAKLEAFKKTLMKSLNEDEEAAHSELTDNTQQHEYAASSPTEEVTNADLAAQTGIGVEDANSSNREERRGESIASRQTGHSFSLTPYLTPRRTPTGTPTMVSLAVSPRRVSSYVSSPTGRSAATSPTNRASSLPHHHATAPNSPPQSRSLPARTPRVDGKEFFRQARSRLSYEQFSAFLANIKELNSHRQSKEETLRKAQEIFGSDNKDLYLSFEGLLSRHLH